MITNCDLLLNSISEAIIILDDDGYITYSNPSITSIYGYAIDELLNKHITILYDSSNDSIKAEYELGVALKKGKFLSEGWRSKKNRDHFWAEMLLSPMYNEQKIFIGYSCVIRDVSQKKLRELNYAKAKNVSD